MTFLVKIHHNPHKRPRHPNYGGFLLIFPRNAIRIRMNPRNSLFNAPGKEVSKNNSNRSQPCNSGRVCCFWLSPFPRNYGKHFLTNSVKSKGDGKRGTAKTVSQMVAKCRKMTFYDGLWRSWHFILWRFMSMEQRDGICHKMSQIVIKCCKLSWRLSQIAVTFFLAVPFPPSPFGFSRPTPSCQTLR